MSDKGDPKYRFQPQGLVEPGKGKDRQVFTNPHLGEVTVGEVYEVPAEKAHLFDGHPDWQPVK